MPARRRLRATLGYHGTHYAGWGVQRSRPTVQSTVERALASALAHPVRVTAAGRTDAGVHAEGQVISFDTTSAITTDGLAHVLRRSLPVDVWVRDISEAHMDFDARRSARRRWYRYALWRNAGSPAAAWLGRCLVEPRPLELAAMREASRALIGRHDFASLVTRPAIHASTDRTVFAADWLEVSRSLILFEICADAYLKQMVRTIVGSLLWVGLGRWQPDQFAAALDAADRRAAGPNAPAVGLTLHRIEY
jgi:tRNA pseudouridine38-40 synthase